MTWKTEWKSFALIAGVFLFCYYLPVRLIPFDNALTEALRLVKWYAREHVILCLVPAFFIAGAIAVFVSKTSVLKYLGAGANKLLAYGVASVSGAILAVCSCTVLPLFAGIYRMGAGLGPATAFLYSGPGINILAIVLTARILGPRLGIARAAGAIIFAVVIGLLMHVIFREKGRERTAPAHLPEEGVPRPLWQTAAYFASMVAVLVFANWGTPGDASGFWSAVYSARWPVAGAAALTLGIILAAWFDVKPWKLAAAALPTAVLAVIFPDTPALFFSVGVAGFVTVLATSNGELNEWLGSSWDLGKQILPLLLLGVLAAGALLGRPDGEGLIPSSWVSAAVGGESVRANLIASVAGAFMYFATLTEVPILEGLLQNGMGNGPALALLLAGPALSLPNMLVIRSIMGTKKTAVYVLLVVVMATVSGLIYGGFFAGSPIPS